MKNNVLANGCHGFSDIIGCHGFADVSLNKTSPFPKLKVAEYEVTQSCIVAREFGACEFCYNYSRNNQDNELPQIRRIEVIEKLSKLGITNLIIGGGEPLDIGIANLLDIVKQAAIYKIKVFLTTSGVYFTEEYIASLKEVGLNGISVSLDGSTSEINALSRAQQTYNPAIKTIQYAVKHKMHTSITTTASKYNYLDLPNMMNVALNLGVDKLYIIPLVCVGRATNKIERAMQYTEKTSYVQQINLLNRFLRTNNKKLIITIGHPFQGLIEKNTCLGNNYMGCTAALTDIGILPDGTLVDCAINRNEIGNVLKMNNHEIFMALRNDNWSWSKKQCSRSICCRAEMGTNEPNDLHIFKRSNPYLQKHYQYRELS